MFASGHKASPTMYGLWFVLVHSESLIELEATWKDFSMVCRVLSRIDRGEMGERGGCRDKFAVCDQCSVKAQPLCGRMAGILGRRL